MQPNRCLVRLALNWLACYVLAMPDATSGQEPVPADEFDRELRELIDGTAGDPLFLEPSAAERANGAAAQVRRARRGRGLRSGSLFVAVFLLLACVLAWLRFAHATAETGYPQPLTAGPAGALPATAWPAPSGTVYPVDLFAGPPADPFAGTLADHWADGAAGIVAPAARPVATFTAAQVAAAYATARALVIAASLDRQTLLGGAPTAFARLLTAAQRAQFLAGLGSKGVTKDGLARSTRTLVASFAPGSTGLIGDVIKVAGLMSARAITEPGTVILAIDVNYLFAYVIEPPHDPADWIRVVVHEHGSIDFARGDGPRGVLEPWDRAVIAAASGAACGSADGYIHPDYPSDSPAGVSQPGPAINPYSLTSAPGGGAVCGGATGA